MKHNPDKSLELARAIIRDAPEDVTNVELISAIALVYGMLAKESGITIEEAKKAICEVVDICYTDDNEGEDDK